ncbi:Fc.00g069850.m01.CDS01 [Cosmosporella sp. VM-42]
MPPKQWDDEDSDSSTTPPSSPPLKAGAVRTRRQFDDEEDDSDVLDSWSAAEDSEVEREKAKNAADAKAKADAAAAAAKKPKALRIAEKQTARIRKKIEEEDDSDEDETEAERRERLLRAQQEADLSHAADMFGDVGISAGRAKAKPVAVVVDSKDPNNTVDISKLPLFNPSTKLQFDLLRTTLSPIIANNVKKAHYSLFLQEFAKGLARDMPSEQIKKLASGLTALSNEKMREEKAADKGGKKTKAAKTKTSLVTGRANVASIDTYENDDFGDDDFM